MQRRIVAGSRRWLASGGHLLIETSAAQAEQTAALFSAAGLSASILASDAFDATVVAGVAP